MSGAGDPRRRLLVRILAVLAVGALLGRLGPFDTFSDLSSGERYGYWIGLTMLMWVQGVAVLTIVSPTLASRGWSRWAQVTAAALLASIPTGFEVAWAEMFLRVERDLGPIDLLAIIADVALLCVPLLLLTHGILSPAVVAGSPAPDRAEHAESLIAMVEPQKRGPILALRSEDHYVRIYTERGDALVLMRFADALALLGAEPGLRVHRSWWVAERAVQAIVRAGDGLQLILRNGPKVPVSRSYAQQVRKEWADRF